MDGLLKPVSTSYSTKKEHLIEISKSEIPSQSLSKPSLRTASTPEAALDILKSEPDLASLASTLRFLNQKGTSFDVRTPGAISSQLVHVLVSETVPNYWRVLAESENGKRTASNRNGSGKQKYPSDAELLLSCLRSVPGLKAILLSLKQHIQSSQETKNQVGGQSISEVLAVLLQVLEALLEGENVIQTLWEVTWNTSDPLPKRRVLWNEFLGLLGGKILGVAAESEDILNELDKESAKRRHWVADGTLYAAWVARNITSWSRDLATEQEEGRKACSEVLSKSFRLGHTDSIIKEILTSLLLQNNSQPSQVLSLLNCLPNFEQRICLLSTLKTLSKDHLSAEITTEADSQWWKSDKDVVAAAAGLINIILAKEDSRKGHLITWLTSSSGAGVGEGIAIRRAVFASLSEDKSDIEAVLEKSIQQFGDQLYIKHVPSMQQEVHAQVLLLSAGYLHRKAPLRYSMMIRSGSHLKVVSNRLGASSPRARFLGMVIAESLSGLVDKGDKKMDFKMDEMNTPEARWYKGLVDVSDSIGSLDPLKSKPMIQIPKKLTPKVAKPIPKVKSKAAPPTGSRIISIEEISDDNDEESDEDGLQPYAKPDSDAEDSDEDATLVTRNKPTAPVYIRDLILYLRDSDNFDKQKLGLLTAASLIRRKTNFGTEVSAHAEDLAALLVGIQDKYEIDNFDELRLQGMIAILAALPLKMGQWFSKTFFDGDYSFSQRASILTTLGLGARELAGFGAESNPLPVNEPTFPSKSLPEAMHKRFASSLPSASSLKAINNLSNQLQNTYINPLAASIADQQTGPAVLKLQSFTSRVKTTPRPKTKAIPNLIAQTISTGIFFPLTGRFHTYLKALGSRSSQNIVFQPHLLTHFLKTLSVLLHSAGPSTLSLPQMTSEYWELLLSLRTKSIGDIAVLEGVLFGFLTIMEVNEEKRGLVEEHGGKLLETQDWVEGVFGRLGGGGDGEEKKVRMLAAGVLVRIREVVERYQALLMGDLARFES